MQGVSSFSLNTLSERLLHHNRKIMQNSKGIVELKLWIFCFVKKMCVELLPLVDCFALFMV